MAFVRHVISKISTLIPKLRRVASSLARLLAA